MLQSRAGGGRYYIRRETSGTRNLTVALAAALAGMGGCHPRTTIQREVLERRQRAAVERGGQRGAAGVGDLCAPEVERLELLQASSLRRQHTCRRRQRHEGGDALVAERVAIETELHQRGQPPQGRREGH
eukprot:scaffold30081_cov49-Phaeocystis_antarctica.AAC.3